MTIKFDGGGISFTPTMNDDEDRAWKHLEMMQNKPQDSYLEDACEILFDCEQLMRAKGKDYQGGSVKDADYYPHGWQSFDTMLTTKILRFRSVMEQKGDVNFDSAEDCLKDLINYSARCIVWMRRQDK